MLRQSTYWVYDESSGETLYLVVSTKDQEDKIYELVSGTVCDELGKDCDPLGMLIGVKDGVATFIWEEQEETLIVDHRFEWLFEGLLLGETCLCPQSDGRFFPARRISRDKYQNDERVQKAEEDYIASKYPKVELVKNNVTPIRNDKPKRNSLHEDYDPILERMCSSNRKR